MDKEFMSDYYEMRYDSLMTGAEQLEDPEYRLASTHLQEAEDELAKCSAAWVQTDGAFMSNALMRIMRSKACIISSCIWPELKDCGEDAVLRRPASPFPVLKIII